jgi:formylglycine-generating enzyme required for sulfatase activity
LAIASSTVVAACGLLDPEERVAGPVGFDLAVSDDSIIGPDDVDTLTDTSDAELGVPDGQPDQDSGDGDSDSDEGVSLELPACVPVCNGVTCDDGCRGKCEGQPCNDDSACTSQDACATGACVGLVVSCDDQNPCSDDACDPTLGCEHASNSVSCDDGNACTVGDACADSACVPGKPKDCDDTNGCTKDSCVAQSGLCQHAAAVAGSTCEDGSACTFDDRCQNGACEPGVTVNCADANPCTDDGCDAVSGCNHSGNAAKCEDGNPCTDGDLCAYSTCGSGSPRTCSDGKPCTADACQPVTGACLHTPTTDGVGCDDGNACSTNDKCDSGVCKAGTAANCDDGNGCTFDGCFPASGCKYTDNSAPCDDGNSCTSGDVCAKAACVSGKLVSCDDKNPCTDDKCNNASGCAHLANSASCDDGDKCTASAACSGGSCVGSPLTCTDNNPCTTDSCDPGKGCLFDNNNLGCDDGDACTVGDACQAGACKAGEPKACGSNETCVAGACKIPTPPDGMVLVPAGKFLMGCVPGDSLCNGDESPRHEVTLEAYYIDVNEVTVARYKSCLDLNECTPPDSGPVEGHMHDGLNWNKVGREQYPVNGVNWKQADAYCKWAGGRLPTEAEWEKAARGGLEGKKFPWGDESPTCAPGQKNTTVWYDFPWFNTDLGGYGCGTGLTWAVGTGSAPNGYGLNDMTGNVWEWVGDWYSSPYYGVSPTSNPQGPGSGTKRVVRGGGYVLYYASDLYLSRRDKNSPSDSGPPLGFRCAKSWP